MAVSSDGNLEVVIYALTHPKETLSGKNLVKEQFHEPGKFWYGIVATGKYACIVVISHFPQQILAAVSFDGVLLYQGHLTQNVPLVVRDYRKLGWQEIPLEFAKVTPFVGRNFTIAGKVVPSYSAGFGNILSTFTVTNLSHEQKTHRLQVFYTNAALY